MTFMLLLKNVKINNEYAEADYFPENSICCGHIKVLLTDESVYELTLVDGYSEMHPAHAAQALIAMARTNDIRTERIVMWY